MTRRARAVGGRTHLQGTWLDARGLRPLGSRELEALVERGVTGIAFTVQGFERAIDGELTEAIEALALRGLRDPRVIYERASVEEVRAAADALASVYELTAGRDGCASLELSPAAGHDTRTAAEEGKRLFHLIGRRNVMLQVPATAAGTAALTELVAHGIGVSVTLVTTPLAYEAVAGAHLRGVERFLAAPRNGDRAPAVVASIPAGRLDRAADRSIDAVLAERSSRPGRDLLERLARARGRTGSAIATLAFARRSELSASAEWGALSALRLEHAPLVSARGSPSANTIDAAWSVLGALVEAGVSPAALADRFLADEVAASARSFQSMLARVARVRDRALARLRHTRRHPYPAHNAQGVVSGSGGRALDPRGG